jgi:hypothetical protein
MAASKLLSSFAEAVARIPDGAVLMIDGFGGPGGTPQNLIRALRDHGAKKLTIISNTAGLGSVTGSDASTPGIFNLFEFSLDDPLDLENLQAGSFILATLTFDTLTSGTSPLSLSVNAIGDAYGDPFSVDLVNGRINVIGVPEPATLILMGSGLAGLGLWRRRRDR